MGFVEDHEVVGKEKSLPFRPHLILGGEQGEEERVVQDQHFGGSGGAAGILVGAAAVRTTAARGADMGFAADLGPDIGRGGEIDIAEGAVPRLLLPFPERAEFIVFACAEEISGGAHGPGQALRTEVVPPAF